MNSVVRYNVLLRHLYRILVEVLQYTRESSDSSRLALISTTRG